MNENYLLEYEEVKVHDKEFIEEEIELLSTISFLLVSVWG
jgi:hypothetical protein